MIDSPRGSRVDDFRSREDFEIRKHENKKILLPYLIMMATQLPLVLVYLKNLMGTRPHYKLLPIAFIGTAVFLYLRWPRKEMPKFFPSAKSDIFLMLGILFGVGGAFMVSPWLAYAAFLCFGASLLARTNDRYEFGNSLPALAPLVVLLQPPIAFDFDTSYGDIGLISFLNRQSANLANDILDLARYVHNFSGNSLELITQRIDSLEFGNGALSLFTLLIVTGLFIGWQRRPMFRAFLLLLAACFWFMTCEAVSLVVCGISMETFETDLFSDGDGNRLLQFGSLGLAGILTVLSDRLIAFFFGPVDTSAIDDDISYQEMVCRFWNNALAGVISTVVDVNIKKEVAWAKRRNSMPSIRTQSLLWFVGMGSIALAVLQTQGLISAYAAQKSVFQSSSPLQLSEDTFPKSIGDLEFASHEQTEAPRATPFHADADHWIYTLGGVDYHIVMKQPFHGWHDLQSDLLDSDWRPSEQVIRYEFDGSGDEKSEAVFGEYRDMLANFRHVYGYQTDGFGRRYLKPVMWTDISSFIGRSFSAIGWRSHPRLLDDRLIELVVYVETIGEPSAAVAANCEQLFQEVARITAAKIGDQTLGNGSK